MDRRSLVLYGLSFFVAALLAHSRPRLVKLFRKCWLASRSKSLQVLESQGSHSHREHGQDTDKGAVVDASPETSLLQKAARNSREPVPENNKSEEATLDAALSRKPLSKHVNKPAATKVEPWPPLSVMLLDRDLASILRQVQDLAEERQASFMSFIDVQRPRPPELPYGWEAVWCSEQDLFHFFHSSSKSSTWTPPLFRSMFVISPDQQNALLMHKRKLQKARPEQHHWHPGDDFGEDRDVAAYRQDIGIECARIDRFLSRCTFVAIEAIQDDITCDQVFEKLSKCSVLAMDVEGQFASDDIPRGTIDRLACVDSGSIAAAKGAVILSIYDGIHVYLFDLPLLASIGHHLKTLFSSSTIKLIWDCRLEAHWLAESFDIVTPTALVDMQIMYTWNMMSLAGRRSDWSRRGLPGLHKVVEESGALPQMAPAEIQGMQQAQHEMRQSQRNACWLERPLQGALTLYCAVDVFKIRALWDFARPNLHRDWTQLLKASATRFQEAATSTLKKHGANIDFATRRAEWFDVDDLHQRRWAEFQYSD